MATHLEHISEVEYEAPRTRKEFLALSKLTRLMRTYRAG